MSGGASTWASTAARSPSANTSALLALGGQHTCAYLTAGLGGGGLGGAGAAGGGAAGGGAFKDEYEDDDYY